MAAQHGVLGRMGATLLSVRTLCPACAAHLLANSVAAAGLCVQPPVLVGIHHTPFEAGATQRPKPLTLNVLRYDEVGLLSNNGAT